VNLCQSVSVPNIATADGLPVMVYIHAGGHVYHSYLAVCLLIDHFLQRYQTGNISGYPQANLIADSQNRVITVFMQYRLGAFGNVSLLLRFHVY
jgi:carboxylesterase type B